MSGLKGSLLRWWDWTACIGSGVSTWSDIWSLSLHKSEENVKYSVMCSLKHSVCVSFSWSKDFAAPTPSWDGGKRSGSNACKTGVSYGKSSNLSSRGSESRAGGSKSGGSRGSLSHQDSAGQKAKKQGSQSARSAVNLRSSRSFSSLQASCLTAAPFMRSSRSLTRLDQKSSGNLVLLISMFGNVPIKLHFTAPYAYLSPQKKWWF